MADHAHRLLQPRPQLGTDVGVDAKTRLTMPKCRQGGGREKGVGRTTQSRPAPTTLEVDLLRRAPRVPPDDRGDDTRASVIALIGQAFDSHGPGILPRYRYRPGPPQAPGLVRWTATRPARITFTSS